MGEYPGAGHGGRPRTLLILGRLQVGLLLACAVVLIGEIGVGWLFSGWEWPRDSVAELCAGLGSLVLGGIWLAATRPAWTGRIRPLITVAVMTVPVALVAGLWLAYSGVLAVPLVAVVLPVAILVVRIRQRRAPDTPATVA